MDNQLEDGRGVVQKKATEITDSGSNSGQHLIGEQESTAPPQHHKGVPLKEEKESKEWNDFGASSAVTRSRTPSSACLLAIFPGVVASPLLESHSLRDSQGGPDVLALWRYGVQYHNTTGAMLCRNDHSCINPGHWGGFGFCLGTMTAAATGTAVGRWARESQTGVNHMARRPKKPLQ